MAFIVALNALPSQKSFHSFSSIVGNDSAGRIQRRDRTSLLSPRRCTPIVSSSVNGPEEVPDQKPIQSPSAYIRDEEVKDLGVRAALSMLRFYKREISPLLLSSCRYVPTCSEYSMEAYKKYGFVKGTVLTAWRLCRCNPLGGSGFDPPRWFNERSHTEQ